MRDRWLRMSLCALVVVRFYPGPEATPVYAFGMAATAAFICLCLLKGTVNWKA